MKINLATGYQTVDCTHCHGTGLEPDPNNPPHLEATLLLRDIREVAESRWPWRNARTQEAIEKRDAATIRLGELNRRGRELNVSVEQMCKAAKVSKAAWHNWMGDYGRLLTSRSTTV